MTSLTTATTETAAGVVIRFTELQATGRVGRREEARTWLRSVLVAYLGIDFPDLELTRRCRRCDAPHGRPELGGRFAGAAHFSLSRSGRHAALAVSDRGRVGVDIETVRPAGFLLDALSPDELARFRPEPSMDEELIRLWVRKEAVLKVSGLGLAFAPNRLTVDRPTPWCAVPADDGRVLRCALGDVDAPAGTVAAVALDGAVPRADLFGPVDRTGDGTR